MFSTSSSFLELHLTSFHQASLGFLLRTSSDWSKGFSSCYHSKMGKHIAKPSSLTQIDLPSVHCKVFEDNSGALEFARLPKIRPRTKHINQSYHFFHEALEGMRCLLCLLLQRISWQTCLPSLFLTFCTSSQECAWMVSYHDSVERECDHV